ncbi:hypothetical protein [Phreatobacter stygius]|uniref:Uncharacterized protein n=1 Tax=Phreatobacter stygius TaxID=1940610 RepID=A0A4D7B848_9HYPH|nr:hypothetical protein [Phreatobacter stygius]QCI66478.1 hypothetical protein E8M01_20950 [Phreatobacter stygius]
MTADAQRPEAGDVVPSRPRLLPLITVTAIGGMVLGATVVLTSVGIAADLLRLGTAKDRLGVALLAALWGAPAGAFTLLWLVLRAMAPDLSAVARVLAGAGGICVSVIAAVIVSYIQTTSPPPQTIYLSYEIRLPVPAGAAEDGQRELLDILVVSGIVGRSGTAGPTWSRDAAGRTVVTGKFWLSRRDQADIIVVYRQRQAALQFTLALPPDPPATSGFEAWRPADRQLGRGHAPAPDLQAAELRLRIDRVDG